MRPASIINQFSAGGVIYRKSKGRVEVALISLKGGKVWSLPKGLVNKGESPEETAIREVREETGLVGAVAGEIGSVSYWYFIREENARCKKKVKYYLMEYIGGKTTDHDSEVDDSSWFPMDEAITMVSYRGDREILGKARDLIEVHGREGT